MDFLHSIFRCRQRLRLSKEMMHYAANKKSFHNTQKGSQTASGAFYFFPQFRCDKAVIISEEGNGKSTLLKLIYDSRLVDSYV